MFNATSIHFYLLLYHVCSTLCITYVPRYEYSFLSIIVSRMFHATSVFISIYLLYHAYSPRYEYSFLSIIVPWFLSYVVASKRTRHYIILLARFVDKKTTVFSCNVFPPRRRTSRPSIKKAFQHIIKCME